MKRKVAKIFSILLVLVMCISVFTACNDTKSVDTDKTDDTKETTETEASIIGADNISIDELSEFDPLEGVSAKGTDGKDATSDVKVKGEVNTLKPGDYELTYTLKGTDLSVTRVITVKGKEAVLANGTYNYKFAKPETRLTLMAAAENYLLHNQHAGVPLYGRAGFALFSNRMQLVSEEYVPVMEFGASISTMVADDSQVLMEDGKKGNPGEYTYRNALSTNPTQWNQWLYEDEASSDVMMHYLGSLYSYDFNDDKTGYVVKPSMAAEDPIPIESRKLESGKVVSKKWQIKVRDGLQWKFNENTNKSMITDTEINATDFYETYKLALEEKWFRAISGGGDFCTSTQKVVNAQEFVDGVKEWDDVGIKLIDENTIEFQFIGEQSEWNVKYWLASFVMTPINIELYETLGENYGLDEKSIAYHGPYYVDYYESDKVIRMKKNDLHHEADRYFYTGRLITIIEDSEMRFQEFVAGKLDATGLPSQHYEKYKNHPGLKRIPGDSTVRLMINGLGAKEAQLEKFPESEWEPEPILANQDFKMGMYHAIDRNKLAKEVMKVADPQMYLFTDIYVVDGETGIPYRNTPQGKSVGSDLSPSTHAYNLDAAKAYFEKALDSLVSEGVYKNGDEITFELYFMSGSEASALMGTYVKDAFEAAFNSEKHNVKVTVEPGPKDFPGIYYDHMMVGEFDTGVGSIGGNSLDAAGFLDNFCSDNRNGFTLNWGIDTSVPDVTVSYKNTDGKMVKELWSYDALVSALNGEIEVIDGKEAPAEEESE